MSRQSHEYRKRPPRLGQVFGTIRHPLYFVTMVTHARQPILANSVVHQAFDARAKRQELLGIGVGCYVIMPDHIHVFIRVGHEQRLGETIKHLKQSITKAIRIRSPETRVWQPGFFDHLLRNSESYSEKWTYVRNNPVRAGLCESPEAWPFQGEICRIVL